MRRNPCLHLSRCWAFSFRLVAIGIGFDAINGESAAAPLSRVLAQPIYRDALLLW
jgi:ABC-2 type transport system permease protein